MNKQFFYFSKLDSFDLWSMSLYAFITFLFFIIGDPSAEVIFFYGIFTQLVIYFFCYKSIRNLNVYIFWILVSLFHLYLFFHLIENQELMLERGHGALPLRNTLPALLVIQILRFLSRKLQNKEFVSISGNRKVDMFDKRKVTFIDILLVTIYIITLIVLDKLETTPNIV